MQPVDECDNFPDYAGYMKSYSSTKKENLKKLLKFYY